MKRTGPIVRENAKTVHEPERLDLIVRGGRVVTPEGVLVADGVADRDQRR